MTEHRFGEVAGVPIGTLFATRQAAYEAGVHRATQGGIVGRQRLGAESVVVNKGYRDDRDYGDVVIYTGQGGRDPNTGNQIADQLFARGNRALALNRVEGIPVRVIRGWKTEFGPATGYRYDGLFWVDAYRPVIGEDGYRIWQYRLVDVQSEPGLLGDIPDGADRPERRESVTQRLVRNTTVGSSVKAAHEHRCQICDLRLETPAGPYAEAAHIRPLGQPHDGPDSATNILCLCPNHHVLLDSGSLIISDDLSVVASESGRALGTLRTTDRHPIDLDQIRYHRHQWS